MLDLQMPPALSEQFATVEAVWISKATALGD
jgi:hypothetical protein